MPRLVGACVVGSIVVATLQAAEPQGGENSVRPAVTTAQHVDAPRLLPGTRPDAAFATIEGNALNSTDHSLVNTHLRLRDARTGRIVDTQLTDQSGAFSFTSVDPGSYIVEILGPDQMSVVASSQVLDAGAGEVVSAVVKLPFKIAALGGLLGNSTPSAAVVAAQAAASGVLASQVTGAATCVTVQ